MSDDPGAFLSVAETCRRLGLTARALRLYERKGLVAPRRTAAGWRVYGPEEIARLHKITALKSLGFPLAWIKALLDGGVDLDRVLALQEEALARDMRDAKPKRAIEPDIVGQGMRISKAAWDFLAAAGTRLIDEETRSVERRRLARWTSRPGRAKLPVPLTRSFAVRIALLLLSVGTSWLVSGCAAFAPPEPCTSAWYDAEAHQAFRPVRRELGGTIRQLQSAQQALESPEPGLGAAVRVAFAANAGLSLIETLDRESLPRLRSAADMCDDPGFVRRAVFDFLDEEGVDDLLAGSNAATAALGLGPALEAMLATASSPP